LKVRDARGALSAPATVKVFPGNGLARAYHRSPAANKLFKVGEQITLQGSATDKQDGQLPDSALSWEVRRHHNGDHWHPYFSGTGNDLKFSAPPPEGLDATGPGNYLEIRLTVADSQGLSKTMTQELQPNRVNATFESQPTGLELQVNGTTFASPQTLVSWESYKLAVHAPSPQTLVGIATSSPPGQTVERRATTSPPERKLVRTLPPTDPWGLLAAPYRYCKCRDHLWHLGSRRHLWRRR
jgi:hypothetical protein